MENSIPNSLTHSYINVQEFVKKLQALTCSKNILIAYSGGLDSHVLLHLASKVIPSHHYNVRAIHINHGLQKEADGWVQHCHNVTNNLNISLKTIHLDLSIQKGESVENIARIARYAAFKEHLESDEILLTAHHQNDQAETMLLQLFRGAGVQGLAAMPHISNFADGQHARPLLSVPRQALEAYALEHQLSFIEDPSNQDSTFDRNFLRNEVMPMLKNRWPSLDKTISRSAMIQAETKDLLDDLGEQDLSLLNDIDSQKDRLSLKGLGSLSHNRQKLLIRYWIASNGFNPPSEKKLSHIFSDVINANDDAQPLVKWSDAELRRYQGELYIMPILSEHDNTQIVHWAEPQLPLLLTSLNLYLPVLSSLLYKSDDKITVRFRKGGETFHHAKRDKTLSLKNIFNEEKIPPWQRSRIPLIYAGNTLIKISGLNGY